MKTFGKVVICIVVVLVVVVIGYITHKGEKSNSNTLTNTVTSTQNTNNKQENIIANEIDENKDYIGEEEKQTQEDSEQEKQNKEEVPELTGKDKAVDIVKKQYALDGQTVKFDHMEGENYVVKINDGTAVTWYLVNGATWEAEEY